mmetsp:Transcript_67703/g.134320  ORF Transcript_67703/g.134320 Transcript_67703/m.134320 type:complete len:89 (+) Transcript_67703:70-336(+)
MPLAAHIRHTHGAPRRTLPQLRCNHCECTMSAYLLEAKAKKLLRVCCGRKLQALVVASCLPAAPSGRALQLASSSSTAAMWSEAIGGV